jgi:hypothetical protein
MDAQGLLLTTAELAVAFAGFSSLVGVFSRRRDGRIDRGIVTPLRVMLDYSLITLFSSLIPFLPMAAGATDKVVWQFSSAVWIVGIGLYLYLNRRWLREVYRDNYISRAARRAVQFLDWASLFAMMGNALEVFWSPSLLVYYAVLMWYLGGAALGFVQVVASTWREPEVQHLDQEVDHADVE